VDDQGIEGLLHSRDACDITVELKRNVDALAEGDCNATAVMPAMPSATSPSTITSQALQQSLYCSIPHSTSSQSSARMKLTVLHPTMSYMAYKLDLLESKTSPQRQIVVQITSVAGYCIKFQWVTYAHSSLI
jgi:hypothetical protein